ncbi:BlaI/MecI/CopY family transcriptional regulator [Ornithinimicrobium sp. F0845]|uniref:BlaI/MecI/CopY family transcriptional regulator n=1 Tax=Ornithinimicrobium sp. F0845 TaxID=2926412 RepID=UPI001FF6A683|nr:BlaI/MecI/CopY family transcriptional regulator [Ornithinimicrobium sp. F0845]MCK0112139.1 BlaI/MecI/CopY family transcriptional regulator [Ornithinimicrobium sp. F0845]
MWPFGASLGDLERAVMDVLWDSDGDLSVREVHERLDVERDLAYTTVMTVLDRLAKKKVVSRARDGRAWRYSAVGSREEMTAASMRTTLETLDSSDRKAAMLHFIGGASEQEIADLQALLEANSRKSGG